MAKVSGGPKESDRRASAVDTSIGNTTPNVPAMNEPIAGRPNKRRARCDAPSWPWAKRGITLPSERDVNATERAVQAWFDSSEYKERQAAFMEK